MLDEKHLLFHHLNSTPGIGGKTLRVLLDHLAGQLFEEDIRNISLADIPLVESKKRLLRNALQTFDEVAAKEELVQHNIDILLLTDESYPRELAEIPDAPTLLSLRGNAQSLITQPKVAVIGTRKPSRYGLDAARTIARELAQAGVCIVSGMALGLDSQAHEGAMEAKGTTIAVLGNGLSDRCITPRSHLALLRRIINANGAIVSEYAPGVSASTGTFPARNRIIAGLCNAVIVVEAAEQSGTLITARFALDYNRDVFAVPGSIFSRLSDGPHSLIREGAAVFTDTNHFLETIRASVPQSTSPSRENELSEEECAIVRALDERPLFRQEILKITGLKVDRLAIHLTMLEMNGFIKDMGNGTYRKI
jgi:DNA processing protein